MKTSLQHVKELDGIRGCAALAVLVLHIVHTVTVDMPHAPLSPVWSVITHITGLGVFGVDVFFVLSGFLITSLLLLAKGKEHYFNNFYWKRVLRIQPVYLLHLLGVWFFMPHSNGYILLGLLFIVNFADRFHVQDRGPAWTLSIEEQFYLIWPFMLSRLSLRNIYRSCVLIFLLSAGVRIFAIVVLGHLRIRETWFRFDGLALGALLACQWIGENQDRPKEVSYFLRVLNSYFPLILGVAFTTAYLFKITEATGIMILAANYLTYRLIRYVIHHPGSLAFGWLASPGFSFFGAISYSLYMFHPIILDVYDNRIATPSLAPAAFIIRACTITIASVVVSVLIRYAVELPAEKLRRFVLLPKNKQIYS
jgi:peptidoglycan/LPS O-acetylase OafA/YrhL